MTRATGRSLDELASHLGGWVEGDGSLVVERVAPLQAAGPRDLSFLSNPRYLAEARATRAGGVIVARGVELPGRTLLVVPDPYLALAGALELLHPYMPPSPGISPQAVIGKGCSLGRDVVIQAGVVVGDDCAIGDRCVLMPGVVLGRGATLGEDDVLHPNVVVHDRCRLGNRVIIHAGTVIGSDGFGFAKDGDKYRKIPQVGNVVVEDDVEIGSNVSVDRATLGSTVIGQGTKIDNLVQIGHNVQIGENSVLVAQVGISGSTRLGKGVTFAGQSGAVGHIDIGDGVIVGAKSAVTHDLPAGSFVIGHPAIEAGLWKRAMAVFARLPEMRRRLLRLEAARGHGDKEE